MVIDKSKLEQTASKLGLWVSWNNGKPGYYSGCKYIPFEDLMYGSLDRESNEGSKMNITEKVVNSEQFKYSEKILDLRYDNRLSLHDMVNIAGLTKYEYLRLEACDITIPVEEYMAVITLLEEYLGRVKGDK